MSQSYYRLIDASESMKLRKIQLELSSVERVIKLCLDDKFFNISSDNFKAYQDRQLELLDKFDKAKTELYNKYIKSDFDQVPLSWNLDYDTNTVKVTVFIDEESIDG